MQTTSLSSYIPLLESQEREISASRKEELEQLANLIKATLDKEEICRLMSICTHNSRRSQLMEAWLVVCAHYYDVNGISVSSGGTEATAFNIRMVVGMRQKGFHLVETETGANPKYNLVPLSPTSLDHVMFSKKYDNDFNPQEGFIALMVCDHADQNCPIIPGASHRISLPYIDPKVDDDTPMEYDTYMAKIEEIGREIVYMMGLARLPK